MLVKHIHTGQEWIDRSRKKKNCTHQVIIMLGRVERVVQRDGTFCSHQLAENASEVAVVYMDGSVYQGDRSGWTFSARIKGKVVAALNRVGPVAQLLQVRNFKHQDKGSCNHGGYEILLEQSQRPTLYCIKNKHVQHEWELNIDGCHIPDLVWI